MKKIIVTGGHGFIGSTLIKELLKNKNYKVLNLDSNTYASNPNSLKLIKSNPKYKFSKINICHPKIKKIITSFKPNAIFHLAAESHVDNSILKADNFIKSNINGTFHLLKICNDYLNKNNINDFRFIHVSTDEVYGSKSLKSGKSKETDRYEPNSPYSASKAASDHLVRAWFKTYNFPAIITHSSNNYGPWQNEEKFIPVIIKSLIKRNFIPIYGKGKNIRNWIYVQDHANALISIYKKGILGETYNIGTTVELSNIELVNKICNIFNKKFPNNKPYQSLISFVKDRPGHDLRYSLNTNKLRKKIKFKIKTNFTAGLLQTINWYISNYK